MKKIIIVFLIIFIGMSAYAVKYKVNSSGKVTSENGDVQNNVQKNLYNNYYAQPYINEKKAVTDNIGIIDIVMDYSGSMTSWIDAAKKYAGAIISQTAPSTKTGLRVFGQDSGNNPYNPIVGKVKEIVQKKDGNYKVKTSKYNYLGTTSGSCSSTSQLVKTSTDNSGLFLPAMNSVRTGGSTPLTLALHQAVEYDFAGFDLSHKKKIILITDGGENCGGDPCAFIRSLVKARSDIVVDVVLVSSDSTALKCLTDATNGKFYNPVDVQSFIHVLNNSIKDVETDPDNVLPENTDRPSQQYEYVKD